MFYRQETNIVDGKHNKSLSETNNVTNGHQGRNRQEMNIMDGQHNE